VVDRAGKRTTLSGGWISVRGLAWTADGSEVWFGASRGGPNASDGLYAVTPAGQVRSLLPGPTRYKLFDVAADGRVLLGYEREERSVEALMAGSTSPVDVAIRSSSNSLWISPDGMTTMIADQSTPQYETYMLKAGGTPVHLGPGQSSGLSPDGRWALAQPVDGMPLFLHPTGPGDSRELPDPERIVFDIASWLDNTHIVGFGQKQGQRSRGFVQDINSGPPRPFTPEGAGVGMMRWWSLPVSSDGTRVIARSDAGVPTIYRIDGGPPEPVPGLHPGELPIQWTPDGHGILVAHGGGLPWIVEKMDLATGRRTPALTIRAHEPAGLRLSLIAVSPDARYYVHSFSRLLTDLFVVQGLK
jgi:eukaryotic-like serine/threonine-protein kinase